MTLNPKERKRAKAWFIDSGLSISAWAAANGLPRDQVYAFLSGKTSGRRGVAHQIGLALRQQALAKPLLTHHDNADTPSKVAKKEFA